MQGAGVHGTHAQPSYAHDVHSRAGVSSSDVHSSAYAYNRHSSGASASHHSQPQHSAYSQPPFTSAYETQQAQAHAQQPQPTYQPYTQSQFDRVPQTYHSSPGVQTPTPQKEATATPAREPYRAEQSYQQQSQEHKEPERPASRPVTPPVVSPRPVVITCPFEKLEKVVKDMNRVRVTLERDAFRALTHTDSLQDADVLKKRKNYDESLTHCMLQLDAIEATGEDRERIKSERRVIISSIQKLQACLEEYVEYAHHHHHTISTTPVGYTPFRRCPL